MNGLDQQHIIVTGAAGDIGRAITDELTASGATVTAVDVLPSDAVENLWSAPDSVHYACIDVTNHAEIIEFVDSVERVDAVVGNAGIVEPQRFVEIDIVSWRRHLEVNLIANFNLGQAAARRFIRDETPGCVVFTGSWVQERPWPEIAAYSASKAGLNMMAKTMALELAATGIRVNVVAPGIVAAGLARQESERNPDYARRAAAAVPMGRLQEPRDVAAAVGFLCGPAAANITGSCLLVDGGCSLGSTT